MRAGMRAGICGAIGLMASLSVVAATDLVPAGAYRLSAGSIKDIHTAIENGIEKMNFITRPIARSRLRKTNAVHQRVAISRTPQEISIAFDGATPVRMPADGAVARWTREDGETFDVSARSERGALVQTFKAEDGERVNRFSLDADGTLTLHVVLTSPQLPAPISYALRYAGAKD